MHYKDIIITLEIFISSRKIIAILLLVSTQVFFGSNAYANFECTVFLNAVEKNFTLIENESAIEDQDSVITWDQLVEIFVNRRNYYMTYSISDELIHFDKNDNKEILELNLRHILGPAFKMPIQNKPDFIVYHFMAKFKIRNEYVDHEIIFNIDKKTKNLTVFIVRPAQTYTKNRYFEKVTQHNQMMSETEDEYYTIQGFHKGIKTLKVSSAIQFKIETRHQLELYDVVEPLHVGRIKTKFINETSSGIFLDKTGHVIAKTSTGENIKIILEIINEGGETMFLLKSAYRPE